MPKTFDLTPDQEYILETAQRSADRAKTHTLPAYNTPRLSRGWNRWTQGYTPSAVVQLLRDCNGNSQTVLEPRSNLPLWRALWSAIPIFPNSSDRMVDAMGKVSFKLQDPGLQREVDNWVRDFKIYDNRKPSAETGFNLFLQKGIRAKHRNGMGFGELFRERGVIAGARMTDPALFDHRTEDGGYTVNLVVQKIIQGGMSEEQVIRGSRRFLEFTGTILDEAEFYWAAPLMYNAIFGAGGYVRAKKSRGFGWVRNSTPPSQTVISGGVINDQGSEFIDRNTKNGFLDAAQKIEDTFKPGMNHSLETGEPFDLIHTIPGNITMDTKMFGEGVNHYNDFREEMDFWAVTFGQATGIPVQLTGFPIPGGISEQQWSVILKIWSATGDRLRQETEPIVRSAFTQFMESIRAPLAAIESAEIEWEPSTPDQVKEKAEAGKIDAERVSAEMMNIMDMIAAGAVDEATAYAEEIGRPGLANATPADIGNEEEM